MAHALRQGEWEVRPAWNVRKCDINHNDGQDTYECSLEADHLGCHRWMVEGNTMVAWPEEVRTR